MPADAGGSFDSSNSSNTEDDKKSGRGIACIAAWCSGRHSREHPVLRISVQPTLKPTTWMSECRTLMKYLRRNEEYTTGVIAAFEAASKVHKQCDYRVHAFHFLKVEAGGGHGRATTFIPFDSVEAIVLGDPVFNPSNSVCHAMLRKDVAAQMQPIIPPTATPAYVAYEKNVEQKK